MPEERPAPPRLIAVVEDEPDIQELISLNLEKARFRVKRFSDGAGFMKFIGRQTPDLIILDLMLPDLDGLDICRWARARSDLAAVPIIVVSARGEEADRVLGLELGANDYLSKPFSVKELVARVRAALRPLPGGGEGTSRAGGRLVIDQGRHEVRAGGRRIELTATEFRLLELLSSREGWVFSRERILDQVWGEDRAVIDRTVDVHIANLRNKLGEAGKLIRNVRGVGYKLDPGGGETSGRRTGGTG
jgi:DNA-binding response OmpR family regulator